MMRQAHPVQALFNLVDRCNQCTVVFRISAASIPDVSFRRLALLLEQTLDRFGYELTTEIRRIAGESAETPALPEACSATASVVHCETALRSIVQEYEQSLMLPAHARAMAQRHCHTLKELLTEFQKLSRETPA